MLVCLSVFVSFFVLFFVCLFVCVLFILCDVVGFCLFLLYNSVLFIYCIICILFIYSFVYLLILSLLQLLLLELLLFPLGGIVLLYAHLFCWGPISISTLICDTLCVWVFLVFFSAFPSDFDDRLSSGFYRFVLSMYVLNHTNYEHKLAVNTTY